MMPDVFYESNLFLLQGGIFERRMERMHACPPMEKGFLKPSVPQKPQITMTWWIRCLLSISGGLVMALAFPPYDYGDLV